MKPLWRGVTPLVLASKSFGRRALLAAAGIPFEVMAAEVDEGALAAPMIKSGAHADDIAAHLAKAKALSVSAKETEKLVLGADQILTCAGEIFTKPGDLHQAKAQLERLSGRCHELHSAFCLARGGRVLFEAVRNARLTCRTLSADFIETYLAAAGTGVMTSVGAYQLEGLGIHLFDKIEGDQATILGLPLLPLFEFLRQEGSLAG